MSDAPQALAEFRRKKRGPVPRALHYLVRCCPFCGKPHSHTAPGLQLSQCVDRPPMQYIVVLTEGARDMKPSTEKRYTVPADQKGLVPPATRRSNQAPNVDPHYGNGSSVDPKAGAPRGATIDKPKV
jgi:hypothetical protein